jgi:hypothetical protein
MVRLLTVMLDLLSSICLCNPTLAQAMERTSPKFGYWLLPLPLDQQFCCSFQPDVDLGEPTLGQRLRSARTAYRDWVYAHKVHAAYKKRPDRLLNILAANRCGRRP